MNNNSYISVTEISGDMVSKEQFDRLCERYNWACGYCKKKDVVEVACGSGQGLGLLLKIAKSVEGGDYSEEILGLAKAHYGERVNLRVFDAHNMPFKDNSKDVVILFEAIYYLKDVPKFIKECKRILRTNGMVLIATANKDLYDFNPSPKSYKYYGVVELNKLFLKHGFNAAFYGGTPISEISILQKVLRPIKKAAVMLNLIPKTMKAKKYLKRLVFGKLMVMPPEVDSHAESLRGLTILNHGVPEKTHKVIYCVATKIDNE